MHTQSKKHLEVFSHLFPCSKIEKPSLSTSIAFIPKTIPILLKITKYLIIITPPLYSIFTSEDCLDAPASDSQGRKIS